MNRPRSAGLGYHEPIRLQRRPVKEALPEGLLPLASLVQEGLATGERSPRSDIDIRRSDTLVPLGVGTTVLFGTQNEPSGVVALFQDLTDVRRQEHQIVVGDAEQIPDLCPSDGVGWCFAAAFGFRRRKSCLPAQALPRYS